MKDRTQPPLTTKVIFINLTLYRTSVRLNENFPFNHEYNYPYNSASSGSGCVSEQSGNR